MQQDDPLVCEGGRTKGKVKPTFEGRAIVLCWLRTLCTQRTTPYDEDVQKKLWKVLDKAFTTLDGDVECLTRWMKPKSLKDG